jgi:hypothetical protein
LQFEKYYYMNKRFAASSLAALSLFLGGVVVSCNSDDTVDTVDTGYTSDMLYSSTAITSFSLQADDDVLENLDSIYFTIDLEGQQIYNADSLPLGTDVSKLVPEIGTSDASKVVISYTDADGEAQEVEYDSEDPDTICFNSPVRVAVTSYNESYTRTYTIKINVHKQEPDSLCWGDMAYSALPAINSATDAVTVEKSGEVYCYSTNGTAYQRAHTADPSEAVANWTSESVNFGFTPDLQTLTTTDDAFYVLADDGALWASTDGLAWSSTGKNWTWIYGAYQNRVVGVAKSGSNYVNATYPEPTGFSATAIADGLPVSGTSHMFTFTTEWSTAPQGIIAGGRTENGKLTSAVWGYDGTSWVKFANMPSQIALDGMSLFPYFTFKTNTDNWETTTISTIFAMGGRTAGGALNREVYVSRDLGLNWHVADTLLQMPADIESFSHARALVIKKTLYARSAGANSWKKLALRSLPAGWSILDGNYGSRAVTPITEWQCPYIYIYGGKDANGDLRDMVLRGVINRLTYKPLQ